MERIYLTLVLLAAFSIASYSLLADNAPGRNTVPGNYGNSNWSRFQDPEDNQDQILWQGPGWYSNEWYDNEQDYKNRTPSKKKPKSKQSSGQ